MNNGLVTQPCLHIDVYAAQTGRMNSVNEIRDRCIKIS